jgi:myosin I
MYYRIEYNKKPGKLAVIKAVKDPAVPRDDIYKSGTIHTSPGESPRSVSKPTPKGKAVPGKPITQGKLLRPGGPGGGPAKLSQAARKPTSQRVTESRPIPQSTPKQSTIQPIVVTPQQQVLAAAINDVSHSRTQSSGSFRAPPPPPPPPAPAPSKDPTYRVMYDFIGQSSGELSIKKDEIVLIIQKEGNGPHHPLL